MVRRAVLAAAASLWLVALPAGAQPKPDFSGRWAHDPERFTVLRNIARDGRGGWTRHLELGRQPEYVVDIAQTGDSIRLTFPTGSGNFLTRPTYSLSGAEQSLVTDHRDFWTKDVQRARWEGARLRLQTVSLAGWWGETDPAEVATQPTELGTVFVLSLAENGDLAITTTVSDEKGEAEYRQVFVRRFEPLK